MPAQNWYDLNEGRNYPLAGDAAIAGTPVPKTAILDAELFVLAGTGLASAEARLIRLTRLDGVLRIDFAIAAAGNTYAQFDISFAVAEDSPRGAVHYADVGDAWGVTPYLGSGFIVTGDLTDLLALLQPGEAISQPFSEGTALEPARVHVDPYSGVFAINLAVEPGLEHEPCGESLASTSPRHPVVVARDLHGAVYLQQGYNTRIGLSGQRIELTSELGAGDGVPTIDILRVPQDSSSQPDCLCGELVYTINGVPPDSNGNFKISGGPGVALVAGENNLAVVLNESALFKRCAP